MSYGTDKLSLNLVPLGVNRISMLHSPCQIKYGLPASIMNTDEKATGQNAVKI